MAGKNPPASILHPYTSSDLLIMSGAHHAFAPPANRSVYLCIISMFGEDFCLFYGLDLLAVNGEVLDSDVLG